MYSIKFELFLFTVHLLCETHGRSRKYFRDDYAYFANYKSFYKISDVRKTWVDAKKACDLEGASLYYPNDMSESRAILEFWSASQSFDTAYIGMSSTMADGVYDTVSGQSVADIYSNFAPGEPNAAGGEEACVVMRRDGLMYDELCSNKYPYICKKTAASIQWNSDCHTPYSGYVLNSTLGKCYKFHLTPMNWTSAYAVCAGEQSYLAIINSQAEDDFLVKLIAKAPKDNIGGDYLRGAAHIGFLNKNNEGWKTIQGVKLADSGFDWDKRYTEPNGEGKETCGSMFNSGPLNDIGCFHKCFFICEHDMDLTNEIMDDRKRG